MATDLKAAQAFMQEHGIAGWLTRDYRYSNPIFFAALDARPDNLTRPVWLWIPADSDPLLLAHDVDVNRFGDTRLNIASYSNRDDMILALRSALPESGSKIAMDYSPMYELPRIAQVDAGSIQLVTSFGPEVVSSADIVQYATERWSDAQLASHRYAMREVLKAVHEAFDLIAENIRWKLTEHDVAEFIRGRFDRAGLTTADGPVVAFDANSSDPHYEPTPDKSSVIRREGWLLIDAWAKAKSMDVIDNPTLPNSQDKPVYADITWVAKIGAQPTAEQQAVFDSVRRARDAAYHMISERHQKGDPIQGWEVDRIARESIRSDGYASAFVHRLGHSIGTEVHSNAVNLDDWETHDTRTLIPGIAVTIEPGIYLPNFGVRLEMDIYIGETQVEITGIHQENIIQIQT